MATVVAATLAVTALVAIGALVTAIETGSADEGSFTLDRAVANAAPPRGSDATSSALAGTARAGGTVTTVTMTPPSTTSSAVTSNPSAASPLATGNIDANASHHEPDASLTPQNGVFSRAGEAPIRLAGFVVLEGIVFTSASAIHDHDELALFVDGQWSDVEVLGRDPFTDIAVLDMAETDLAQIVAESDSVWSMPDSDDQPLPGAKITVKIVDTGDDETIDGVVIGSEQRALARSGLPIYGSLLTSAPKPEGASGAALVDDDGAIVGLIVDSASYLVSAVPVDRMMDIGNSLQRWGVPALEWLGITGWSLPDAGVQVSEVEIDGPAYLADLRPGDVIMAIDETKIIDWAHLVYLIRESGTGTTITVFLNRSNFPQAVEATVGSRQDRPELLTPTELATSAYDD